MAKTETEIITSAREHSRRMQADVPGLIEQLVTIQISSNLDVTKNAFKEIDNIVEKWRTYVNSVDFDIQEAYYAKKNT